jgi:hypothetical protein
VAEGTGESVSGPQIVGVPFSGGRPALFTLVRSPMGVPLLACHTSGTRQTIFDVSADHKRNLARPKSMGVPLLFILSRYT